MEPSGWALVALWCMWIAAVTGVVGLFAYYQSRDA